VNDPAPLIIATNFLEYVNEKIKTTKTHRKPGMSTHSSFTLKQFFPIQHKVMSFTHDFKIANPLLAVNFNTDIYLTPTALFTSPQ